MFSSVLRSVGITSFGGSRATRVTASLVLALAFSFLLAAAGAQRASACVNPAIAPLPLSTFEGADGDQCDSDGVGPLRDWQSLVGDPGLSATLDAPSNADTIYGSNNAGIVNGATDENIPDSWNFTIGNLGAGKYDALASDSFTDPLNNKLFLDLGFTRATTSGDTFLAFELNQKQPGYRLDPNESDPNNPFPVPTRTSGDLLVTYHVGTSGAQTLGLCVWDGNEHSGQWEAFSPTLSGAKITNQDCPQLSGSLYQAAINDGLSGRQGAIPGTENYLNPGTPILAGQFGEAVVNLTDALRDPQNPNGPGPCVDFGYVWMHTRSSAELSSNQQDFILPTTPVSVANCTVSGIKFNDLNANGVQDPGENGLAGWTIFADYNDNGVVDPGEPSSVTSDGTDGHPVGYYSLSKVKSSVNSTTDAATNPAGKWRIREVLQPNWECTAAIGSGAVTSPNVCPEDPGNGSAVAFELAFTNNDIYENHDIGNHRQTGTLTVTKDFVGTAGLVNLQINDSTAGTGANVGDGGTTGAITEDTGNYKVGETAGTGTDLNDYTSATVCKVGATTVASGTGTSLTGVPVGANQNVVCTITNTRKTGTLEVVKDFVGTAGLVNLQIDDATAGTGANVGDGGTTGAITKETGNYKVGETAGTGTSLGDYTSGVVCKVGVTTVASGSGTSLSNVPVGDGQAVVCTITNTRKTGTLEVVKDFVGTAGKVNLQIDDTTAGTGANVGDGGTTGAITEDTGTYKVGETAGTGTSLSDYSSATVCKVGDTTVASGSGTSLSNVPVGDGQAVVCTITNTRKTGTLEVVKDFVGTAGLVNLQIDDSTAGTGANVGDGGTTGAITEDTGTYKVGETAGTGTDLNDYSSATVCKVGTTTVASGTGTSLTGVPVGDGDHVVCTITNTRLNGTLRVDKHFVGTAGKVNLQIDDSTAGTGANVGDGGTTGAIAEDTGTYKVGETAGTGTSLSDYNSAIVCKVGATTVASGTGTSLSGVPLESGQNVVCTITNTRKTGTITVIKNLVPSDDNGLFNLSVDGTDHATNVGDAGTTGAVTVDTGAGHSVGESAGTGTSLSNYISSVSCSNESQGSGTSLSGISIAEGQNVTCTITNTRKAHIVIAKEVEPASATPAFGFHTDLPNNGGEGHTAIADGTFSLANGESTSVDVAPGTFTVTEDDPKSLGYKLTGLACVENKTANSVVSTGSELATVRQAEIHADAGETITCTYHNRQVIANVVVIKAGNVFAYHGDTVTYTFSVSNAGNTPLHDVVVTDDKCPNVSAQPTSKINDNGDNVLDPGGETWVYTCSYVIGAHVAGEANPIVNTATVNATDEYDRPVSSTDKHSTQILHQSIGIDKTGPATVQAGQSIPYVIKITNTGDTSFASTSVVVTDPLCEAPPLLVSRNGDTSATSFDPGDVWTYTCSVGTVSAQGGQTIHNVATVNGTDIHGRTASASDPADTTLSIVAAVINGTAKLRGPSGCAPTNTSLVVTGKQIASVTFTVDGKKVKTLKKPDKLGRYVLRLNLKKYKYGSHRVKARVVFVADSQTKPKTLTMLVNRCRPKPVPKFTG